MSYDTPIQGCRGCESTGGIWSCPIHSPNAYMRTTSYPQPFVHLLFSCPNCGEEIQFDGYKAEILGHKKRI